MILKPFFRRHFLMTSLVFLLIMTLATFLSHYFTHLERAGFFKNQGGLILAAIEKRPDRIAYIKGVNDSNRELGIPIDIDLIQDGQSLLTGSAREVPEDGGNEHRTYVRNLGSAQLVVNFPGLKPLKHGIFNITFVVTWIAILLASALSMFLLFWSFRAKADLAKNVLTRMQKGDLKVRFPTSRLDETGQMMVLFNQMADEIERLVEQLKLNEKHRLQLLQELTHDLRTPVSSLRNLIETLRFDDTRLAPESKAELMELAFQETEYLTRLVEDLLFLALVLEPKYKSESGEVFVQELVLAQLSAVAAKYPRVKSELRHSLNGRRKKMTGNPHLMQRLFRNALENAFSYAREVVEIELKETDGYLTILVRDDGPGLSPEALDAFGKKRSTRYQGPNQDGRISVGLGSVIIQAIAVAHGGSVQIRNLQSESGQVVGAELMIRILCESPIDS